MPVYSYGEQLCEGIDIHLLSWTDYYAFGGQLPGRSWTSEDYRFGYQGREKNRIGKVTEKRHSFHIFD